jgi:hypothetical protein
MIGNLLGARPVYLVLGDWELDWKSDVLLKMGVQSTERIVQHGECIVLNV